MQTHIKEPAGSISERTPKDSDLCCMMPVAAPLPLRASGPMMMSRRLESMSPSLKMSARSAVVQASSRVGFTLGRWLHPTSEYFKQRSLHLDTVEDVGVVYSAAKSQLEQYP